MCFKFGDDRFRGLTSAEGQILPFPIDFDGRPYNTVWLSQADWGPEVGNLQVKQYHWRCYADEVQYGQEKNATVKTWGNEPKWENSRWPPFTQ